MAPPKTIIPKLVGVSPPPICVRAETKYASAINVIWGVQMARQKYSDFPKSRINLYSRPSRLIEGRFAIVTDVRRDAVDADGASDESA
jgi:hypothetical protein